MTACDMCGELMRQTLFGPVYPAFECYSGRCVSHPRALFEALERLDRSGTLWADRIIAHEALAACRLPAAGPTIRGLKRELSDRLGDDALDRKESRALCHCSYPRNHRLKWSDRSTGACDLHIAGQLLFMFHDNSQDRTLSPSMWCDNSCRLGDDCPSNLRGRALVEWVTARVDSIPVDSRPDTFNESGKVWPGSDSEVQ